MVVYVFNVPRDGLGDYAALFPELLKSVADTLTPVPILSFCLPVILLILGDQNMHQRLAAAKDIRTAQRSTVLSFLGGVLMIAPIILLASASSLLLPDITPDMTVLVLAESGFTSEITGAVILVDALAFVVTTGSSYLLASSMKFCSATLPHASANRAKSRSGTHGSASGSWQGSPT